MAAKVRKAAAEVTPEALLFLRDAWRNPKVRWSDRIAAARAVLATGHADVVRDASSSIDEVKFVVQQLVVEKTPSPA